MQDLLATVAASLVTAADAGGPAGLVAIAAALPSFASLAASLAEHWRQPDQQAAAQLELAQASATLSCSNLRCTNFEGGGVKGGRCSGCMTVRYCSKACALAGWWAGGPQAGLQDTGGGAAAAAGGAARILTRLSALFVCMCSICLPTREGTTILACTHAVATLRYAHIMCVQANAF